MIQMKRNTRLALSAWLLAGAGLAVGCGDSSEKTGAAGSGGGGDAGSGGAVAGTGGGDVAGSGGTGGGGAGAGGTTGGDPDGGPPVDPLVPLLTAQEAAAVRTMSPLPAVPPNSTNQHADNDLAAELGQKLFFEKRYSGPLAVGSDGMNGAVGAMGEPGKLSCASCHLGHALDDRRSRPGNVSLGADFLTRNALPIVNSSFYRWTNWAGRFAAPWELPIAVVENPRNMNGDRLTVVHLVFDKYRAHYEAVFGALEDAIGSDLARFPAKGKPKAPGAADGPWEMMTEADRATTTRVFVNFAKAIEAYQRKLVSRNAPFDRFVAGQVGELGSDEVRGLKLFLGKARCSECHSGPHLSDGGFHNIGLAQTGPQVPATDNGRFADVTALLGSTVNVDSAYSDDRQSGRLQGLSATPPDDLKGAFRTPSLRSVAETAPYMHAGQLATLEDVVAYYDRGGDTPAAGTKDPRIKPLGLSTRERADLTAFLRALTGDPVPAALVADTSAP